MLKLADRIANVQHGVVTGGKTDMYLAEFEGFVNALWRPIAIITFDAPLNIEQSMWTYLARILGAEAESILVRRAAQGAQ